jgi:hypothetical protein
MKLLPLKPSVKNLNYWFPERNTSGTTGLSWKTIRKRILKRDNNTCRFCGHKAEKNMRIHHKGSSYNHLYRNLVTSCVACHAVHHIGLNLAFQLIEIWESRLSQKTIVQITRRGKKAGKSLRQIKRELPLKRGHWSPGSMKYANSIIKLNSKKPNFYLPDPLRVVFTRLKTWQIED